jgi:uncharacterized membrane protein
MFLNVNSHYGRSPNKVTSGERLLPGIRWSSDDFRPYFFGRKSLGCGLAAKRQRFVAIGDNPRPPVLDSGPTPTVGLDNQSWKASTMQGAAVVLHHPIHAILVAFPIAFFVGSLGADIIFVATRVEFWRKCALALIAFGILGALAAAITGLIDYRTAPMSGSAFGIATAHRNVNFALVGIFVINSIIRLRRPGHWFGYLLTLAGLAAVMYAGWLGGELVYRHGVGVAPVERPTIIETQQPGTQGR